MMTVERGLRGVRMRRRYRYGSRGERVMIGVAVAEHTADRHRISEGEQEGDDEKEADAGIHGKQD